MGTPVKVNILAYSPPGHWHPFSSRKFETVVLSSSIPTAQNISSLKKVNPIYSEWVINEFEGARAPTCPMDRRELKIVLTARGSPHCREFQGVSRIIKNVLSHLKIKCDFEEAGCSAVVRLENLSGHVESCAYNKVMCHKGCGLYIVKHGMKEHNCVAVLRDMVQDQNSKIAAQNSKIEAQNDKIAAQNEKIVNIEKWIEEEKELRRLAT